MVEDERWMAEKNCAGMLSPKQYFPPPLEGRRTKNNESWKVRRKTVKYHDLDMM